MRLKSLTLKGFKSFPDRTHLDFGPGVSVVVGPNGSGKSNVTDAVLWAMGEQSPLAVRGQSMQDVIFGGGRGVQARSAAEVEIVLDNSDGTVDLPLSEISIVRRLDRAGEGGYRLNGARCRLTDVIEVLSDTGLGKETHSVVSQGRVEAIVTSKPRDRRLLIEEAAGPRQAPQAPPPRAAEARENAGEPRPRAGRRARGAHPPAPAQAPGGGGRAARAPRAPDAAKRAGSSRARRCGQRGWSWRQPRASVSQARAARERDRGAAAGGRRSGGEWPSARWPSAPSATTRWPDACTRRAPRASGSGCARSRPAPARRRWRGGSSGSSWSWARSSGARGASGRTPARARRPERRPPCRCRGRERAANRGAGGRAGGDRARARARDRARDRGPRGRARARERTRGGAGGGARAGARGARAGGRAAPSRHGRGCRRPSARPRTGAARPRGWAASSRLRTSSCAATQRRRWRW